MGVPGDDSSVTVVLNSGLLEGQLKCLSVLLDHLDPGIFRDGDTILVPGQLGGSGHLGNDLVGLVHASLDVGDGLLELGGAGQDQLGLGGALAQVVVDDRLVGANIVSANLGDEQGDGLGVGVGNLVPICGLEGLAVLEDLDVGDGVTAAVDHEGRHRVLDEVGVPQLHHKDWVGGLLALLLFSGGEVVDLEVGGSGGGLAARGGDPAGVLAAVRRGAV